MSCVDDTKNVDVSKDEGQVKPIAMFGTYAYGRLREENSKIIKEFDVDDVTRVEADTNEYLRSFSTFYDRDLTMLFIGRIPFVPLG